MSRFVPPLEPSTLTNYGERTLAGLTASSP